MKLILGIIGIIIGGIIYSKTYDLREKRIIKDALEEHEKEKAKDKSRE